MDKDYYKILGVSESDSADEIKQAYRKLVRKWHPDVAGSAASIILKFKEINEAYEILSDRLKKDEYDRARRFYNYARNGFESQKPEPENIKQQNTQKNNLYFKNFSIQFDRI